MNDKDVMLEINIQLTRDGHIRYGMNAPSGQATINAEHAPLLAFARGVLKDWPDCMVDGGDIHDLGVASGLLIGTEVTEPCGEGCNCVEYGDFPLTCYRKAGFLEATK